MHQSAIHYAQQFFETYLPHIKASPVKVVEIGSLNVNGSLRDVCPSGVDYIGLDFSPGNGVDIVIEDPYCLPLPDASADVVVSSSCFEHSEFFWLTFLEAIRLLKEGGVFYLNAPSNGFFHRWPVDCWRFYPDSGMALVAWAKRNGYTPTLLESFIGQRSEGRVAEGGAWNDFVAVFLKDARHAGNYPQRIIDLQSDYRNGYHNEKSGILNLMDSMPDASLLAEQETQIAGFQQITTEQSQQIARHDLMIDHQKRQLADQAQHISNLQQTLSDTAEQVSALTLQLAENGRQLAEKDNRLAEKDRQLAQGEVRYQQIIQSKSWVMTKPLRLLARLMRGDWRTLAQSLEHYAIGRPLIHLAGWLSAARSGIRYYGSWSKFGRKALGVFRREGFPGLIKRKAILQLLGGYAQRACAPDERHYENTMPVLDNYTPLVSIIVPNYNHAPYLRERLNSIYTQSYQNFEVILMDDFSSDDSRTILEEFSHRYAEKTRTCFNEENSGSAFRQWKKGIELAQGELIWIAESDDFCSSNFIEEHVKNLANEAVMLSFSRTVFVKNTLDQTVWTSDEYLADVFQTLPKSPFIKSAHWMVNHGWAIKNVVANVSSAIFRKPLSFPLFQNREWVGMRVCGDWIFYLHIIRGGLVAYTPECTNHYRQHEKNTSVTAQSETLFYAEHEIVAQHLVSLYRLEDGLLERMRDNLAAQWLLSRPEFPVEKLSDFFDIRRAQEKSSPRYPNLLMITYSLMAGGGETFPLMLANLMKNRGYCVGVFNCNEQAPDAGVRRMLRPDIPLYQFRAINHGAVAVEDMGFEVIHSHHAWADISFALILQNHESIRHIVTMHGMYEMMTPSEFAEHLPLIERRFSRIVYTANKNLKYFPEELQRRKGMLRIDNALPYRQAESLDRAEFGLGAEDFVLCIVSRAIPEKGWAEAIEATLMAQRNLSRKIHLLLIGDGPEHDRLAAHHRSGTIHFLGFRENIRDYFAMADLGLIPSRFHGESFPLVLIDCLHAGTPIVASAIGEIPAMLEAEGGMAGVLFDLEDWQIPVAQLSAIIESLAVPGSELYARIRQQVASAARKFDPEVMCEKYHAVYTGQANPAALPDMK